MSIHSGLFHTNNGYMIVLLIGIRVCQIIDCKVYIT